MTPSGSRSVRIQLSASEMNYDKVVIVWSDQTEPPQWADGLLTILTTTTYNPPVKGEAMEATVGLDDMNNPGRLRTNPTIAAGDFQVSLNGGAFANLATLPAVTPSGGKAVRIQLSTTEMNADKVVVVWADQTSPPEWADGLLTILTVAAS